MSRLMSVSMTEQAVVERRKTVTRRKGWWLDKNGRHLVKAGDRLTLVRKAMGRKPGEPLVRLAEVEVVSVRRECKRRLSPEFVSWMMGLPAGWVTDLGLTRNEELKILGNGVVRQQAAAATRAWVCDMRAERAA